MSPFLDSLFDVQAYIHSDRGTSFVSEQLRQFFHEQEVSVSLTIPYNHQGNWQWEKCNDIICLPRIENARWLTRKNFTQNIWTLFEPGYALQRTQPQTKRFQPLQRRTSLETSLLSWLSQPSTVLLRRHARHSKNDPLVKEVKLKQANPHYAIVLHLDGRRDTVLLKDMTSARVPPPLEFRHGIATRTHGPTFI